MEKTSEDVDHKKRATLDITIYAKSNDCKRTLLSQTAGCLWCSSEFLKAVLEAENSA